MARVGEIFRFVRILGAAAAFDPLPISTLASASIPIPVPVVAAPVLIRARAIGKIVKVDV